MANNRDYFFNIAASFASRREDHRSFFVGAAGIRNDGVLVVSRNSASTDITPDVHAEARLCNKLTTGSVVYVARRLKSMCYANAKPCSCCRLRMKSLGVKKAYYTISDNEFGVIEF